MQHCKKHNLIKDYCTSVDMYNLKLQLKTNFKGSDYSNELLHNVVQCEKAKKKKQANPLQDLLDFGEKIKKNGGIFEVAVDGDWPIDQIVIQTALQKSYTILYGDFFIVNCTRGTNIQGMTLLLP
jgi:hypothetical protein